MPEMVDALVFLNVASEINILLSLSSSLLFMIGHLIWINKIPFTAFY